MVLSPADYKLLKDTLESVEAELEELVHEKEWYSTEVVEMVQACLSLLKHKHNTKPGPG